MPLDVTAPDPARMLSATQELAARWHRSRLDGAEFDAGRREGYVQAISLLLGVPHAAVKAALEEGKL